MITLNAQIKTTEQLIEDRFHRHELAEVIRSMPGIGTTLGAEFLAATGGDMSVFASADHLAAYAGLAPAPRDSGRISGNLHRPRRYNRALNQVFYTSALVSIQRNPDSGASMTANALRASSTPGSPGPGQATRQRPVGTEPRPTLLPTRTSPSHGGVARSP